MNKKRAEVLQDFAASLGLKFLNLELLDVALTHSSYVNEKLDCRCNERLEFLGDAVLDVIVSDYIFHYIDMDEGQLTKFRSHFVCEQSFASYGKALHLEKVLQMGKGALKEAYFNNPAVLADAFEAVVAAIYKDAGMNVATDFVLKLMKKDIDEACGNGKYSDALDKNYKSILQETLQKKGPVNIVYITVDRRGPAHSPIFRVAVKIDGKIMAEGEASSVQRAGQEAARQAIENL